MLLIRKDLTVNTEAVEACFCKIFSIFSIMPSKARIPEHQYFNQTTFAFFPLVTTETTMMLP